MNDKALATSSRVRGKIELYDGYALAAATGYGVTAVQAAKKCGFEFTHGRRTTIESWYAWLAVNPGFRQAQSQNWRNPPEKVSTPPRVRGKIDLYDGYALAAATGSSRTTIQAAKKCGFVFTHGRRTTIQSWYAWSAANPGFRQRLAYPKRGPQKAVLKA